MSTYVVCHVARANSGCRVALQEQLTRNWHSSLDLNGTWVVNGAASSDEIRDALLPSVPEGDGLIVVRTAFDAAWHGLTTDVTEWLVEHM